MPSPVADIFEMITRLTYDELTEMSGILISTIDDMADNGDVAGNLLSTPDLRDILHSAATGVMDGSNHMTEATEAAWCDDTLPCARYTEALAARDEKIAELERERETLSGLVQGWHYLAVGPDEMGDYHTQKQLIKLSEPYASPALKALKEKNDVA